MADRVRVPIQEFGKYFEYSFSQPIADLVPYEPRLRVSGFPFCGLKAAWNKMEGITEKENDSGKGFYCDVGTAAHAIFQRAVGFHKRIFGDWECTNADCKHYVKFSNKNRCPKCGSEMRYEEFTVKAFTHVSGHTDGLYRDKEGKYWLIDYKTSSVRILDMQKTERTLPYIKNVHQIRAYVPLLERHLGIKIEGWMLIYIARDNPRRFKVTGKRMSERLKQQVMDSIELYDHQYDVVQKLKSYKQLRYLIETKFCHDRDHYSKHMSSFNGCPLAPVCFSEKQLTSTIKLSFEAFKEKL